MKKEVTFLILLSILFVSACQKVQKSPSLESLDINLQNVQSNNLAKRTILMPLDDDTYAQRELTAENIGLLGGIAINNSFVISLPISESARDAIIGYRGFIVELDDPPIIQEKVRLEKEGKTNDNLVSGLRLHEDRINSKKQQVKENIKKINSKAKFKHEFKNTFNGFSVEGISEKQIEELEGIEYVKKVYKNNVVRSMLMDGVAIVNVPQVWQQLDQDGNNVTGAGEKIAIIDTGVDYTHGDLGGCFGLSCKVIGGYDFVNNDNDPMDDHGHGTHVASIAAGKGVLKGVAPDAKILAYKVLDSGGFGYYSNIIAGIDKAVDPNSDGDFSDHADVISMSLGGPGDPDDPLSLAVDNAFNFNVVVVVAAGNSGPGGNFYCRDDSRDFSGNSYSICSPGTARNALTVGATCKPQDIGKNIYCTNDIASFSSRGPVAWSGGTINKPDVVAPGVNICAARLPGTDIGADCLDSYHMLLSGTSMATPFVAGEAALVRQAHRNWSSTTVRDNIIYYTNSLGYDLNMQGSGLINAAYSVSAFRLVDAKPTFLYYEISPTQRYWYGNRSIRIRNLNESAYTFYLSAETNHEGINITFNKDNVTLARYGIGIFEVNLTVDNNLIPSNNIHYANIIISNNLQTIRIPIYVKINSSIVTQIDPLDLGITLPSQNPSLSRQFTIQNLRQDASINLNIDIDCCTVKDKERKVVRTINYVPSPSFNLHFANSFMTINPGQSVQNTLFLDGISSAIENGLYEGNILISSSSLGINKTIPFYLAKFYAIDLSFDNDITIYWITNSSTLVSTNTFKEGRSRQGIAYLDNPGSYNLYYYGFFNYTTNYPSYLYQKEGISVTGISHLNLNNNIYENRIGFNFTDKNGKSITLAPSGGVCGGFYHVLHKYYGFGVNYYYADSPYNSCPKNYTFMYISNTDAFNFDFGLGLMPWNLTSNQRQEDVYLFNGKQSLFNGNHTFTNTPADLKEVNVTYHADPDIEPYYPGTYTEVHATDQFVLVGYWLPFGAQQNNINKNFYISEQKSSEIFFAPSIFDQTGWWALKERPILTNQGGRIVLSNKKLNNNRQELKSVYILKNNILDVGLNLEFFFSKIDYNYPSLVFNENYDETIQFLSQSFTRIFHADTLYKVYKNGNLFTSGYLTNSYCCIFGSEVISLSGAGNYSVLIFDSYRISGSIYNSTANISFDTSKGNSFPIPNINSLKLYNNNDLLDTIYSDKNLTLEFQIANESDATLTIFYDNGTIDKKPLKKRTLTYSNCGGLATKTCPSNTKTTGVIMEGEGSGATCTNSACASLCNDKLVTSCNGDLHPDCSGGTQAIYTSGFCSNGQGTSCWPRCSCTCTNPTGSYQEELKEVINQKEYYITIQSPVPKINKFKLSITNSVYKSSLDYEFSMPYVSVPSPPPSSVGSGSPFVFKKQKITESTGPIV